MKTIQRAARPRGPAYSLEFPGKSVAVVRMDVPKARDWEQWFLIRADVHHDNPHSDRALEKKHLEQAKERGAGVLSIGDTFCAMQGKYDKRSDKSCLRPEHQHGDYLDRLVTTAADFYEPYAHHLILFGEGNHESAIRKRHETDLLERLAQTLRDRTGAKVCPGGYSGWVRFMFTLRGAQRLSRRLFYHHGYGGGGPVTLDTIQGQRIRAYVDADYIVTGHTHDSWQVRTMKVSLNDANRVEHRTIRTVKCTTYKDEYGQGEGGFHIETGKPPKPLGAWWLRFTVTGQRLTDEWFEAV